LPLFSKNSPVGVPEEAKDDPDQLDTLEVTQEYWGATHLPQPNLHVEMDAAYRTKFVEAYQQDSELKRVWKDEKVSEGNWVPGQRYLKTSDGLLFFRDADYQPRLCVPEALRWELIREVHDSPMETAHVSPERLWG
jgi:hypothetical protein